LAARLKPTAAPSAGAAARQNIKSFETAAAKTFPAAAVETLAGALVEVTDGH